MFRQSCTLTVLKNRLLWRKMKEELRPKREAASQFSFVEVEKQPLRRRHVLKSCVAVDTQSSFDRSGRKTKPLPQISQQICAFRYRNFQLHMQMVIAVMAPLTQNSRGLESARTKTSRTILHVWLARLDSASAPNTGPNDGVDALCPLINVRPGMNDCRSAVIFA